MGKCEIERNKVLAVDDWTGEYWIWENWIRGGESDVEDSECGIQSDGRMNDVQDCIFISKASELDPSAAASYSINMDGANFPEAVAAQREFLPRKLCICLRASKEAFHPQIQLYHFKYTKFLLEAHGCSLRTGNWYGLCSTNCPAWNPPHSLFFLK